MNRALAALALLPAFAIAAGCRGGGRPRDPSTGAVGEGALDASPPPVEGCSDDSGCTSCMDRLVQEPEQCECIDCRYVATSRSVCDLRTEAYIRICHPLLECRPTTCGFPGEPVCRQGSCVLEASLAP